MSVDFAVDQPQTRPGPHAQRSTSILSKEASDILRQELVGLMYRVAAGDRGAFDQLHRKTNAKLFGIAMKFCGDRAAAEDVLADAYVSVWRSAKSYNPRAGSPITWLAAVTRNRAIDWRRSQKPSELLSTDLIEVISDPAPSTVDRMVFQQDRDALQKCFNKLPFATRIAIHDAFFEGFTYSQLAVRAGIPLGTMKSVIRRGLMTLRRGLSD